MTDGEVCKSMLFYEYKIMQGGEKVVTVQAGNDMGYALRQVLHYVYVYSQDGPLEVWGRKQSLKWEKFLEVKE